TGDQGRWRADGTIEFLGRNDHQVKVRGFRIELGEIETALRAHPQVREAVVLAQGEGTDKRLVAYLVGAAEAELAAATLRAQLQQVLPEYMVPSAYVWLEALPLTANGKLDRAALPAVDGSAVASKDYVAPQGPTEAAIAQVWQELLGLERVGRHDHFFELGGHSLLVVVMIERLRERGVHVDVRSLFEAPTVAQLAQRIRALAPPPDASPLPPNRIAADCARITPGLLPLVDLDQAQIDALVAAVPGGASNVQDIYPLSPLQEGLLFHHLLQEDGDTYLLRSVLALDSRTRLDAFLDALQRVIDRHDVLRSAVHWEGLPEPVQVVQRQAPLAVEKVVPATPGAALDRLLELTDPRRVRMDVRRAPLLRAYVMDDPATDGYLCALLNHHLVSDHVTLELILAEIRLLLQGQASALPPPLPYRNFIAHSRAVPQAEHERYFRAKLHDVTEPTAPFDLLDLQADAADVVEARVAVDPALARAVREQARRCATSPATLFHVAWAQVLARCSDRDDVVFGTLLLGRGAGSDGAAQVPGMFVNTLPLRIPLRDASAHACVRDTHGRLGELLMHEQAPLALAQRCSGVDRTLPLFTTLFNYRHSRPDVMPAGQGTRSGHALWDGIRIVGGEERTNYPIAIAIDDLGQDFAMSALCVRPVDAERLLAYLRTALASLTEALAQAPQRPLRELPILPAQEQAQLERFNAMHSAQPAHTLIHHWFEDWAARQPEAVAAVFEDRSLSYAQLNAQASRLAQRLRKLGVSPEQRVALCAPRGLELVVGILGILKAGGAYVPLDPAYPATRLAWLLEDSAPVAMLTAGDVPQTVAGWGGGAVLDLAQLDLSVGDVADPDSTDAGADRLAYVIYTSGSTGQPKGVMVEHAGLCNLVQAQIDLFAIDCGSRVLQFASPSFDASVSEIFIALCAGARLCLAPMDRLYPGVPLAQTLERHAITHVTLPPSALQVIDEATLSQTLTTLIVAGEALPLALARRWAGSLRVLNAYGPTEATVCATVHAVRHDDRHVPIGRPIANTQVHVLDATGMPVPIGVRGELYIGGAGVARGYLNRAELTAQRFVPDPFSSVPDARLYRTGDQGRWRADGALDYLGRTDHQVKLRGFRIEPGEIEAALRAHPQVREAVVLAQGEDSHRRLVAYVVPHVDAATAAAQADALRQSQLSSWSELFDGQVMQQAHAETQAGADLMGWHSSYTRQPIAPEQMHDWLSATLERLQALSPRRVLEIGCGTGMILRRLAPQCEEYVGTDLSARTLEMLGVQLAAQPQLHAKVRLLHADALQLAALGTQPFDTAVLNSVVQYFPDLGYLETLLERLLERVTGGGHVFLGDLRHHGLHEAFALSVQLHQAPAGTSVAQLATLVRQRVQDEPELLVDPRWFFAWQRRTGRHVHVQVMPKAARYTNEMSAYRYDVVLTVDGDAASAPSGAWRDCRGLPAAQLLEYVTAAARQGVSDLCLGPIDNPRVRGAAHGTQRLQAGLSLQALREEVAAQDATGVSCDALDAHCTTHGYAAELSWAAGAADGAYHAWIRRPDVAGRIEWSGLAGDALSADAAANAPLRSKQWQGLLLQLKAQLQQTLPEYMLPAAYVQLEALPLTTNGKLDRAALPAADGAAVVTRGYVAPQGPTEAGIAQVWQELLGLERVGRHDHFFELGGHSLLAVQLVSRLRGALGVELPLRELFAEPTLTGMAQRAAQAQATVAPPIAIADRSQALPLSWSQQRLWFLDRLDAAAGAAYHIAA
ncbi:non-ribosomal peptide synthetase, partial [Xanthomonas sp. 1678]|uniref:non-ribosomal peptide synthetase n=1 Tax=Xanthomonas sp. 1678 TaxID=3158788 RepID=UPI002865FCF5|nr:amino acid adenylation domain-containing protein [Xanthomonas translucens]